MSKQVIKQGGFAYHFTMMGGDIMKNAYKILTLLFAFGTFLILLLTFIFQFR